MAFELPLLAINQAEIRTRCQQTLNEIVRNSEQLEEKITELETEIKNLRTQLKSTMNKLSPSRDWLNDTRYALGKLSPLGIALFLWLAFQSGAGADVPNPDAQVKMLMSIGGVFFFMGTWTAFTGTESGRPVIPFSTKKDMGRFFHSPVDQIVSVDHAKKIYMAAKHPKSYISLDQADHLVSKAIDADYIGLTLAAWASRYLAA